MSTILLTLPELPAPVKLTLDLDAEQLLNMDGAEVMTASALLVGPDGVALDLPAVGGRFRHLPESWRDWWEAGRREACSGLAALDALRLFGQWKGNRKRSRGEHGPPAAGAELRKLLLSAALRHLAEGASLRAATAAALDAHLAAWDKAEHDALLQRLKRHRKKGR